MTNVDLRSDANDLLDLILAVEKDFNAGVQLASTLSFDKLLYYFKLPNIPASTCRAICMALQDQYHGEKTQHKMLMQERDEESKNLQAQLADALLREEQLKDLVDIVYFETDIVKANSLVKFQLAAYMAGIHPSHWPKSIVGDPYTTSKRVCKKKALKRKSKTVDHSSDEEVQIVNVSKANEKL